MQCSTVEKITVVYGIPDAAFAAWPLPLLVLTAVSCKFVGGEGRRGRVLRGRYLVCGEREREARRG